MGKYDKAKGLRQVRARKRWTCARCGTGIGPGDIHHVEYLEFIRPAPGMVFNRYCMSCYDERGASLIGRQ